MTAPSPAASRPNPADSPTNAVKMEDGFSTLIAFESNDTVKFWEMEVTPPGIEGGDAIETDTMHQTLWRTKAARQLMTLEDTTIVASYDPLVIDEIEALCNSETTITVFFPNGDTYAFYGFLKSFIAQSNVEGTMPQATITITATNTDPTTRAEEGPVFTNAGTA